MHEIPLALLLLLFPSLSGPGVYSYLVNDGLGLEEIKPRGTELTVVIIMRPYQLQNTWRGLDWAKCVIASLPTYQDIGQANY